MVCGIVVVVLVLLLVLVVWCNIGWLICLLCMVVF